MATTSSSVSSLSASPIFIVVSLLFLVNFSGSVSGRDLIEVLPDQNPQQCTTFKKSSNHIMADGNGLCSQSDIVINQGQVKSHPDGIPIYSVEILNECSSGCDIGDIHVKCGEFSSATAINPNIFKRLAVDDCLVNGGKPIHSGMAVSFEYASTFPYPMRVSKYQCCSASSR